MKFNEKIIRLRKIRGITQDELASAVGVSRQAVYKWECGQSYPEVAKLLEIKLLFGISIDDLLDDSYEIAMPEKKKRKRVRKPTAEVNAPAESEEKAPEEIIEEAKVETVAEPAIINYGENGGGAAAQDNGATCDAAEVKAEEAEADGQAPARRGFFARIFGRK